MACVRLSAFLWAGSIGTACRGQDSTAIESAPDLAVIVVVGAEGNDDFASTFAESADLWKRAASHTQFQLIADGTPGVPQKQQVQAAIARAISNDRVKECWIVLIGHGTFNGKQAKFNLRGPDLEATELAQWLQPATQRLVVINGSSCSSPFINELSGNNRVIVTATRDGFEYNYARFGFYLARSIVDPAGDLDKDGQVSLLEAFAAAAQAVANFYDSENRLATEHALIDDNGDGLGTPADWFEGVRATSRPKQGVADGVLANQVFLKRSGVDARLTDSQRVRRDQLELELERCRGRKAELDEQQYLNEIEPILIELARIYAQQ